MSRRKVIIAGLVIGLLTVVICASVVPFASAEDGVRMEVRQDVRVFDRSPENIERLKRNLDAELAQIRKEIDGITARYGVSDVTDITDIGRLRDKQRALLDKKMDRYSEIEVQRSRLSSDVYSEQSGTTRSTPIVTLGGGEYMDYANFGGNDSGKSGICIGTWDSDYDVQSCKAESVCRLLDGSWGSCWAWSQVGQDFYVTGPYGASDTATITVQGDIIGSRQAMIDSDAYYDLDLHLLDVTWGIEHVLDVCSDHVSGPWGGSPYFYHWRYNRGMTQELYAGHYYKVWIEPRTEADVDNFLGAAEADYGTQDRDMGYTDYNYIWIRF